MSSYCFSLASGDTIRIVKELGPWPEDRYKSPREFETYAISLRDGEPAYCYCPAGHRGGCKHLGWAHVWLNAGADPYAYLCDGEWSTLPRPSAEFLALCGCSEGEITAWGGGGIAPGPAIATGGAAPEAELKLEDLDFTHHSP